MEGVGQDRHCTKGYSKAFRNTKIAGDSSYPEHHHKSPEEGGLTQFTNENKQH